MLGKPSRRARKRLEERGVRAYATVLEIADSGMAVTHGAEGVIANTELVLKVHLRVEPEGQQPFEVHTKLRFPQLSVPSPGSRMVVIFDPEDPSTLMRDETAIANLAVGAAGAALRPDQIASIEAARALAQSGARPEDILARVNEIRAAAGQPPAQVLGGAASAPAEPDVVTQLTQLADLRDRGVLTEEEFAAQKARILGGG